LSRVFKFYLINFITILALRHNHRKSYKMRLKTLHLYPISICSKLDPKFLFFYCWNFTLKVTFCSNLPILFYQYSHTSHERNYYSHLVFLAHIIDFTCNLCNFMVSLCVAPFISQLVIQTIHKLRFITFQGL